MLQPWLEAFGVILLALLGVCLGKFFSKQRSPYWQIGYFVPLILICGIGLTRRYSAFEFVPPFSWIVSGRTEFALGAVIGTMVLITPLSRLSRPRDRAAVTLFAAILVVNSAVWPFLAPAFNYKKLSSLKTRFDADGICLQNTEYNCGPASAVTALSLLGFKAEEGDIAILAHTSNAIGTPPDLLAAALKKKYGSEGLICEYRHFKSISELNNGGITLAVIKFGFLVDHYVTVMEVNEDRVIAGDPFAGKVSYSHEEFLEKWRFCGVVLNRLN